MRNRKKPVHFPLSHSPVHVTYRLHGSIPLAKKQKITSSRNDAIEELEASTAHLTGNLKSEAYRMALRDINNKYEADLEHVLHTQQAGPMHLNNPNIRHTVIDSWQYLQRQKEIVLYAICVMSNHVHVIVGTTNENVQLDIGQLMRRHKSHTGRLCNRLLGKVGSSFWAPNYFDRTIRDNAFITTMWYVLNNPVKAQLVAEWRDWPGTCVHPDFLSHFV